MKSLVEFINETLNLNESIKWEGNSGKSKFAPIKGKLTWSFTSNEYGVNDNINCDGWYVGVNEDCIVFWSPKSAWMYYVYISEVKANHTNWALASMDTSLTDPTAVLTKVLEKWDDYRAESATVPELDSIVVPAVVQKIIKSIV